MNYQLSLKFRQFGASWNETFYLVSSLSPQAILDQVVLGAGNISAPRANTTVFVSARVRDAASTRNSSVRKINNTTGGVLPTVPEPVQVSVLVTMNAPNGQPRSLWLRGLPDASVQRVPTTGAPNFAAVSGQIASYLSSMNFLGWAIRHTAPPTGSGIYSWQNVNSVGLDPLNAGWTIVTLSGSFVLPPPGVMVKFRGFQNGTFPYLRGIFQVKSNTGTTQFSIPATWREPVSSVQVSNVQVRGVSYTYDGITGYSLNDFTTRKTGDPTGPRRGRRSAAIRRRLALVG